MRSATMELFDSDVLVDPEFFQTYRSKSSAEPERALLLAVLSEAIDTFRKFAFSHSPRGQRHLRDVEEWIWNDEPEYFFSFVNICDLTGLDPAYLRRSLKEWAADKTAGKQIRVVKVARAKYHTVYKQRASLRRCKYPRLKRGA